MYLVVTAALAFPPIASAWSQYYVQNKDLAPSIYDGSSFNYGVNYNEAYFAPIGDDRMGITLCHPGIAGCYPVGYSGPGVTFFWDQRSRTVLRFAAPRTGMAFQCT